MEKVVCPKCGFECIVDKASIICPNCDFVRMREHKWVGETTICPKCKTKSKVYKHSEKGKTFVCNSCNTIGRYLDESSLKTRVYERTSPMGKRLSWLFEVPCKYWHRRDEVRNLVCKSCDIRQVCDEHSKEIERFCNKKNVEIYIGKYFIEVIHK